jgi:hypothetical protein
MSVSLRDKSGRRPHYAPRNLGKGVSEERNYQGIENRLLRPFRAVGESHARVKRRQRLGGMLSYYYREAA